MPESNPKHSHEWYTPDRILEAVYQTLGVPVDVDPCAETDDSITANVLAKTHYSKQENGLNKYWSGTVYMNPPFGLNSTDIWTKKLIDQMNWNGGCVTDAIALLPNKSDTNWWYDLMLEANSWCCIKGRQKFKNPLGKDGGGWSPTIAVLLTKNKVTAAKFEDAFSIIGTICRRVQ